MKTLKKVMTFCLLVVLSVTLLTACNSTGEPIVNKEFTVTYDLNTTDPNAQFVSNNIVQQVNKYYNSQKITEPSKPIREGFDFGGWYYDKECTKLVKYKWESFDHDVTLYAKWFERDSLSMSFYCNDPKAEGLIEIPMDLKEKYYRGDVVKGNIIKAGYEAFAKEHEANLKGRGLDKNFVCRHDDLPSLKVSYTSDIKVDDKLIQYAEKVDNHYTVKFVVNVFEKIHEVRFLNKNTQICIAPTTTEGKIDFSGAYKYVNGEKVTNIEFEMVNGRKTMPKAVVEKYETFKRWQISLSGVKDKDFEYYNKFGQLIDNKGNLIDESGNVVTEDKAVYFIDYRNYENISDITCQTDLLSYSVDYQLWIPELDENGNIKKVNGKSVYLPENKISLAKISYQYGTPINKLLDAEVKKELDKRNLSTTFKLVSWKYGDNYPEMNVKVNEKVSSSHQLKHDIVVRTSLDVKKEIVRFIKGKDEFFNTKNTSISTTVEYPLKDVNKWLQNPKLPEAFDLHNIVGGMYYVKPGVSVPVNSSTFIKTEEMINAERELLKHQYTLKGFCLSEHKNMGPNAPLLITYDSNTKKLALKDGKLLEKSENSNEIVLKPVFERRTDTQVIIDISEYANKGISIPSALQKELYAQLDTFDNGTYIDSYNNDIKLKGHKFLKWEVVGTPFDSLDLVNKEKYLGVTFNNKYQVIGTTTIKPVFEIDEYTLTFLDTFDKDIFTQPTDKIIANIDDKYVTKAQIDKVIAYQKNLIPNIAASENPANYVFDDWYTSDLKEFVNRDVSLTEFINSVTKGQVADYKFNLSRNITFKARFIPINYKVQFMEFDVVSDKLNTTYKPSTNAKNCVFTFKGINAKYTDNLANEYVSEIFEYVPTEAVFNYVTATGVKKNYVIGWYYYAYAKDDKGNIDKTKIVPVNFNNTSSISADTVPFVLTEDLVLLSAGKLPAGYKLVENNTIKVFPKLAEYDVTIDANGGNYDNYDESGNLKGYKTKLTGIKGGMFGFDIPTGVDDKGNPINKLTNKTGFMIDANHSYYEVKWNEDKKTNVNVYYKDSHYINDTERLRITGNTTLYINWDAIKHNVNVYFYDINGVLDESKTLNLIGTIEKIYRLETVQGELKPVVYDVKKLVEIAIGTHTPKESYYAYIYEMKAGVETYIYDGYYQNPANMFDKALVDRDIHCKLKYNNLHLTLDANGGYYGGPNIEGDKLLESYIDKDSALTINKQGKLTHMEDAFSAYVTKNQENMPGEKADQGAPRRDNYVFAGFATKPNAQIGVDKFYYGYKDGSDIRDFEKIFGYAQINEAIDSKTCWLGDTTKFMKYALDDLIVVTKNNDGSIKDFKMKNLYAQWIPVKTQVEYYKTDKKTLVNVQTDIFDKFGGKVTDVNGATYSDLLMPEDLILNPYKFANNTKDKSLISWVTEDGAIVDAGLPVGKHNTFDFNSATIKGDAQNGFYYLATCPVYENLKTGIDIKYRVEYPNKTVTMGQFEFLENDKRDLSKNPLVLKKDTDGKYYVFRKTYAIGNRVIDSLFNNQAYQVCEFDQGNTGVLKQSGADFYYEYELVAREEDEKLPVIVNTTYKNAVFDRNDVTLKNTLNDPMRNPYYDEATMANKITGEKNYYKGQMVRVVVEGGKYVTQRMVWKSDKGTIMEPNYNDLTKNLPLGDNSNIVATFVGNKKPRIEKINGFSTIILDTVVKGEWVREANSSVNVQLNYYYDKAVDFNGNTTWSKLKNNDGEFITSLKGVVNASNEFIKNVAIASRPSVKPAQPGIAAKRLTWKLGSETGDDIDTVDDNKKLVNTISFADALNRGILVSNYTNSVYVVELNLYETWIVDARK